MIFTKEMIFEFKECTIESIKNDGWIITLYILPIVLCIMGFEGIRYLSVNIIHRYVYEQILTIEQHNWCKDNNIKFITHRILFNDNYSVIMFRKKNDFMAFKLRWM